MLLSSAFAWVALAAFTSTSEAFTIPSSAHGASLAARSANPKLAAAMHYTLKPVKGSKLKKRNSACSSKAIDRESQSKATASPTPSPSKTCKSSSSPSKATSTSLSSATASSVPEFYVGANSYFVHALQEEDRLEVLDAMVAANMKVLRIFLSYTYHNNKGSGSVEMPDRKRSLARSDAPHRLTSMSPVEPSKVGEYDDTILKAIDQLMVECKERGASLASIPLRHQSDAPCLPQVSSFSSRFMTATPSGSGALMHMLVSSALSTLTPAAHKKSPTPPSSTSKTLQRLPSTSASTTSFHTRIHSWTTVLGLSSTMSSTRPFTPVYCPLSHTDFVVQTRAGK